MVIDFDKVINEALVDALGLKYYKEIIDLLHKVDVSKHGGFQKAFNRFYIVRRNAAWRKIFYDYFEKNKNNTKLAFKEVLLYLFEKTGFIEASFSSKLLSTINPNYPIWDKYVLINMGFKVPETAKTEKLKNTINIYNDITTWYKDYLETDEAEKVLYRFNDMFSDYKHLNSVKKIDTLIWKTKPGL